MKKILKPLHLSLLALGLSFFLGACATVGTSFNFSGPSDIVAGKTTQSEILSRFGQPFRVGYDSGNEKWAYGFYHYQLIGSTLVKNLDIVFDKTGTVSSYTYESSDPGEINRQVPTTSGK